MVDVSFHGDDVLFTVQGLHKVWAFKSSLTIPRSHISGARLDAEVAKNLSGFRALGTSVPWLIKAGKFYLHGEPGLKPTFVDVVHPEQVVVIDLRDEDYQQLIIEVEDPVAVVALLATSS
ncbi:hypothetical protein [Hymenobacter negativus]|uniref:Uncharacterized protein n=1 Tax=Hymenobacter negativus TaxID=2795026 RepID=A0ABS3QGB1_9BACT|nr:hypothetical protein [Hymenobacter negativus]MBO2010286.1 hypothetical protein [Hymenobacter negativus]